jgi:hypothetical protein
MTVKKEILLKSLRKHRLSIQMQLDNWEGFTTAQLHHKPEGEGWSLLQAASHLCQAEGSALQYVLKKSQSNSLEESPLRSAWRVFLIQSVLTLPIKFKAPAIVAIPPHFEDLQSLKEEWNLVHNGLEEWINHLPDVKLNKLLFKHPVAGMLTAKDMLSFFAIHFNRHKRQFKRLEKTLIS